MRELVEALGALAAVLAKSGVVATRTRIKLDGSVELALASKSESKVAAIAGLLGLEASRVVVASQSRWTEFSGVVGGVSVELTGPMTRLGHVALDEQAVAAALDQANAAIAEASS